jgi:RND family efflux transporter MFP subunit
MTMMKRGFVMLALLAAVACGGGASTREGTAAAAATAPRAVRTAEDTALPEAGASVPATVVARSRAVLSARATAAVTALPFREGDRFPSGAVLVRLDDRAQGAAHAAAVADAAFADADRTRADALLARDAATPREAEQARARAEGAKAVVLAAREALAYSALRAPFAGTVAARPVHVGDIVGPGTPLLEIEGIDGLELRATLDGAEAVALRPGMRVDAVVDGIAEPVTATVRSVSAAGDPETHRFELRATLPAVPGARSGLFARLALPATATPAGAPARLSVPSSAVFFRGGLTGLYVISEGRARLRWIAAGEPVNGRTEVRAGVSPGERVAVDPADLEDGSAVTGQR